MSASSKHDATRMTGTLRTCAVDDFDGCLVDVEPQQIAEARRRQFTRLQGMADARLRSIAHAAGRRHDRDLFEHALLRA